MTDARKVALRRGLPAVVVVALALPLSATRVARAEVIERVVAVVNEEAIFLSDLRKRAAPILPQVLAAPTAAERMAALDELYRRLLDQMVNEELIRQAGRDLQVGVTPAEVDRAIENIRQQSGLSDAEFWRAVQAQGFSATRYREDVERQLLRLKVLNLRVRSRVNITEDQVRARYRMQQVQARRTSRFRVAHVFLRNPDGGGAAQTAAVGRRLEEVRARIETIEDFELAVDEIGGGELGWLSEGEIAAPLEDALLVLEAGEISPVVRGPAGFHVFLVRERELGSAIVPAFEEVRDQLYQQMLETAMATQEQQFLSELRRDAVVEVRLEEVGSTRRE
ncbi:MAG: SurA N-terminal domain-containing protein [Sandaracinaceae bacterium]